jgi:hypothetical protein
MRNPVSPIPASRAKTSTFMVLPGNNQSALVYPQNLRANAAAGFCLFRLHAWT